MAIPMAGQVPDRSIRRVASLAARRSAKHRALMGTPAGFLADEPPDDRHQLRHEYSTAAAEYVRSAPGAGNNPEPRQLSAEVWAGIIQHRRQPATVSRARGSDAGFPELLDQHSHPCACALAGVDTLAQREQQRADEGGSYWRIRASLLHDGRCARQHAAYQQLPDFHTGIHDATEDFRLQPQQYDHD